MAGNCKWMAGNCKGVHLRSRRELAKTTTRIVAGKELINHIQKRRKGFITAAERAGRLRSPEPCSRTFGRFGKIPLLLSGREVRSASGKRLSNYLDETFGSSMRAPFWALLELQSSRGRKS